ncbi:putative signal transducing protein [Robertkochia solimangrovi]|uniref:putative signal transducing protein n=1 Tax=Robertkochia solimangrovi TaxID=2213046 RepID=UPI00117F96A1|nr:DUF2007 domain-containing protein [Robertkochia solimangrovi]TRZ45193.1 DUF2007 domain-containing protein [Robertkochia solimangrovi]
MSPDNYIKIFTGSLVHASLLETKLKNIDINPVIKNEAESGRLAGFGPNIANLVEVYVHKDEYQKSIPLLNELDKEIEN